MKDFKNKKELHEAKLLIVGDGYTGKTSLMKRLLNDDFDKDEPTTKGIDINSFYIKTKYSDRFKLNLWDFGGQEIYHRTHQFFLSKCSIYIFLWNARVDAEYRMYFGFWLNTVKLLSDGSPIIVVLNKIDLREMLINEEDVKEAFPDIVKFHKVSSKTGEGFDELKNIIQQQVEKLPHIGDILPETWLSIRSKLENLNENYITYTRYHEICLKHGLTDKQVVLLSQYFHDMGVLLHFIDNITYISHPC